MYAIIAFLITLAELVIVGGGAVLHLHNILYNALVYGSPFYLAMNLLNADSAFLGNTPFYLALLVFHVVKYIIIFRAQMSDERTSLRTIAIVLEAAYLCLSAYYVN